MKGKFTNFYALAAILFLLYSFSSSAPSGNTGAPGEGNCTNCHSPSANFDGNVQITGLPAIIAPSTTYTITVTTSVVAGSPTRGGFSMVTLDGSNANIGTLNNNQGNTSIQNSGGKTYFRHQPAQNFNGNNSVSWTVDWTSPAGSVGETVTMYTNSILGNGNGNSSGDHMAHGEASGVIQGGGGNTLMVAITSSTDVSCQGGNDGSATAEATGGSGNYQYSWSNGAMTATINNLSANTYIVTVTDMMGGATETANVTINQPNSGVIVSIVAQQDIDCNNVIGSATANGSGGTGNITYNWSNNTSGQTTTLNAGVYSVTATDANGCTATASGAIGQNTTAPTAEAGPNLQLDCINPLTMLQGTGSTGTTFSYLWSTFDGNIVSGANTLNPTVNAAGSYILTVTNNSNGCTSSDNVTITENINLPVASAGASMTITCLNSAIMLDGTASSIGNNFSYQWTSASGGIVSGVNTLTPTVNAAGQYCIEVSDNNNGCLSISCVIVNQDTDIPTAFIAAAAEINCINPCVTLDASTSSQGANFSYQWTGPNNFNSFLLNPQVCDAGSYVLIVTNNSNGCSASAMIDVIENINSPTVAATVSDNLNCNNSSVTINATSSGNATFSWAGPNGFTSNIANPSVSITGIYSLIVTDSNNGCTATIQALVNETTPPTASISNQINVDCNGQNTGSATVTANSGAGNFTYLWSSGGIMATETGLTAGTYNVTVTDADQCTATATATILEPTVLTANASATGVSGAGANDGTATANPMGGTGNYAYIWSNMMTTQSINGLSPATYSVTITDENDCTATASVIVSSFDCSDLMLTFSVSQVNCSGANDGTISAVVNGGIEPITYMWSNGGMMPTISNLAAGTYSITAVDANNCETTGSATVTQPAAISAMATSANLSCNGSMDGAATATAMGGTGILTYMWDNGMSGSTINGLSAGTYTVVVTDENSCSTDATVTITEPAAIVLSVVTTGETANAANDGTALAQASGGAGSYTFIWSNNENTQMISSLSPGDYCVTVTDANGCTAEACGSVTVFGCGNVQTVVNSTNVSCFGGSDGTATATSFNGTEPYTYQWSNNMTGATATGLSAGVYTVTCTDATACSAIMDVLITEPTPLTVSIIDAGDVSCEGNENGFASASAMGGILSYSYFWNTGDNTSMINDLAPNTYTVTVTDNNNCTAETSVNIELLPDTEPPVVVVNNVMVFLNAAGMASVTPAMVDGGSTDNCGIQSIVLDITEFDCDDIGTNDVVVAVLDNAGLCASQTTMVMVADSIPPVLTCPAVIVAQGCNSVVEYPTPTATDNCSTGNPFIISGLPSGAQFPVGTTTVEWGVNDIFGNPATCSFTITIEDDFSVQLTFTEPTCSGLSDGLATALPSGGIPPFSYLWSDAGMQTTQTAEGLSAGVYSATVTDSNGCLTTVTIEIGEPELIDIQIIEVIPETNDNMDGAITIEVNGGTGNPFTYEWFLDGNFYSTNANLTDLDAGTYVLFVTDLSDCSTSDTVIVDMNVGIFENNEAQQINLYPNPTTGEFHLDIQLAAEKDVSVSVFDVTGKVVFIQPTQPTLQANLNIDLKRFSAGVYLIRMQVGEDVLMKRLVIQK